jgi:O-antigen ligase
VLFAVGFSLPLQGLHVRFAGLSLTATKLVAIILLLLGGLQIASGVTRRPPDRKTAWIALFLFSYGVSSLIGFAAGVPWVGLVAETSSHVALVLFYFLLTFAVRSHDDLRLLMVALVLGGAITALPPVLGQETGKVIAAEDSARFEGFAAQANLLGRDMGICAAVAAGLFFTTRWGPRRLLFLGAGALAAAGLAFSLSRAALVGAVAMWGLWVFRFRRFGSLQYVLPAILLAALSFFFLPQSVRLRLETITDPDKREREGSAESRIELSMWAVRAFASNPIVGVGNLNFIEWARTQPGGRAIGHVVHNGYLEVASGQGLLGFVPWLVILGLAWADYSRAARLANRHRSRGDPLLQELGLYAVFLQIALFGALVVGLAHPMTKSKTMWTLYALSAVVLGLVRSRVAELEAKPVDQPEREALGAPLGLRPAPLR